MESSSMAKISRWGQGCVKSVSEWRPREVIGEAVKVLPGLPWRPQDVGDAGAMGYLPGKAANREWNQTQREKCVAVNKAEQSWRSEECLTSDMQSLEFA
ncbi:hypothetical protein STEG23_013786 [Scotinomys teguina]